MDITTAPHPIGSPTTCSWCKTHAHPDGFALGPEYLAYGREWVCASCARSLGAAFGMVSAEQYERAISERDGLAGQNATLAAELEVERSPAAKLVSLEDAMHVLGVVDLDAERKKRRAPVTPKAAA